MIKEIFKYILGTPLALVTYILLIAMILSITYNFYPAAFVICYVIYFILNLINCTTLLQFIFYYFYRSKFIYKNKIWFSIKLGFGNSHSNYVTSYNMSIDYDHSDLCLETAKSLIDKQYYKNIIKKSERKERINNPTTNLDKL